MTTMTMQSGTQATTSRFMPEHSKGVSQVVPLLVAVAMLLASGVLSILISGPMH